jgi:hypothetical protein
MCAPYACRKTEPMSLRSKSPKHKIQKAEKDQLGHLKRKYT